MVCAALCFSSVESQRNVWMKDVLPPDKTYYRKLCTSPRRGTSYVFRFVIALNAAWEIGYPRTPNSKSSVRIRRHPGLNYHIVWSGLFASYYWMRRDPLNACVVDAVVFSHWILDFVSHRPQMALAPGVQSFVGLGLWNSIPATLIIEGALWLAGIALYLGATRSSSPRNSRIGSFALASFIGVLTLFWITTPFVPQPPGDYSRPVLLIALAVYSALLLLAYWIDRRRISRLREPQLPKS